ncbi:MAG: glycosyltransferase [Flavobacteriaceae bacterium]|nr:glycosyltransferase [Flavobacteriaceae bacterium]
MKVSVITATFNSETTLGQTIASLAEQSFDNIEYIVVDGGSKDDTVSIIKKNKTSISKWQSEPDSGIYDALNKGINLATGDVIGLLHSDDVLASKDVLLKIVHCFQAGNVDGVYGDLEYVAKENTNRVIRYWKSKPFQPKLLKQGWMPAHPTLFLKRTVYEKHGLFNLNFKIAADYDLMLRIFKDDTLKFCYLPKVITKMRVGGMSNRSITNILQKTKEDYRAITLNNTGGLVTLLIKNTSKIKQFF